MASIDNYQPKSGRHIKEDGTITNLADKIDAIYDALVVNKNAGVSLTVSNLRLARAGRSSDVFSIWTQVPPSTAETILEVTQEAEIEAMEWATNSDTDKLALQIFPRRADGTYGSRYAIVNISGSNADYNTSMVNIRTQKMAIADLVVDASGTYKAILTTKLHFGNGFKLVRKNTDDVNSYNLAVMVLYTTWGD